MFLHTSRYHGMAIASVKTPDGREIHYVRRRFVPTHRGQSLEYTVTQGDRLDNIAARTLGSPEAFWRICDANGATRPDALTESSNRVLRIPLFTGTK